jgi:hypothetical protein
VARSTSTRRREVSRNPRSKEGGEAGRTGLKRWFLEKLNTLFGKDDWTTVDPDIELKEWLDTKNDNIQGLE